MKRVSEKATVQAETSTYTENAETVDLTELVDRVPPGTQQLSRVSKGLRTLDNFLDANVIGKEAVSVVPDVTNKAVEFSNYVKRKVEIIPSDPDTAYQLGTAKITITSTND